MSETCAANENLGTGLSARWQRHLVGAGAFEQTDSGLRLVTSDATSRRYSVAQIDDYQNLRRKHFPWRPPLRLTARARFSHPLPSAASDGHAGLRGTAGFGFWNDPFLMTGRRAPTLPRAIWFFCASPPSDMKLDLHTPGWGWKAATIDAHHLGAYLLAPLAPAAVALMNIKPLFRRFWPAIQRTLKVQEALLEGEMTDWHTYILEWGSQRCRFCVDDEVVLDNAPSPRGPLGFVMWVDNQYLVATPWGRFRWGLLDLPGAQWLEVSHFAIGHI